MPFSTLRRYRLLDNGGIRRSIGGGGLRARWLWLISLCLITAPPLALASLTSALPSRFERASLNNRDDIAGFIALGGGDERILEAARLARASPRRKAGDHRTW